MSAHSSLDLAVIGNCAVSALIDGAGRYVWACAPRVDSDPVFCALLGGEETERGVWSIQLLDRAEAHQGYERNTAILRTTLIDARGGVIEIIDFSPRFCRYNRIYRPLSFIRIVRRVAGSPRIRVHPAPTADWGARPAQRAIGSNHIRYFCTDATLRLTTTAPILLVEAGQPFVLEGEHVFVLSPDEPFDDDIRTAAQSMYANTRNYWQQWVRMLATPLEWQAAVIRAAIALKLCVHEESGAIVAALTTSIPETPNGGRGRDYRLCWLRDAHYTVQALNRLGATDIVEGYLTYLRNIVDATPDGRLRPVYDVGAEPVLHDGEIDALPGYRRMGSIHIGDQGPEEALHDVYGQVVLSTAQAFFDSRLFRQPGPKDFFSLERIGEVAFAVHAEPDAGLLQFHTRTAVHMYSVLMCWAACDRLANVAARLGLNDRELIWRERAEHIRSFIDRCAWNSGLERFAAAAAGDDVDASVLQLAGLRFVSARDERFVSTLDAVERQLRRGSYAARDGGDADLGARGAAFNFSRFWFIEALLQAGRREEARATFEATLARRNGAGLLSERCDPTTGELWGNYPHAYSLAGLINCAVLLSNPWSTVR